MVSEIVKHFEKLKKKEYKRRRGEELMVKLVSAFRAKLKTQKELDDHRRGGHAQYSPDRPECQKRGSKKTTTPKTSN